MEKLHTLDDLKNILSHTPFAILGVKAMGKRIYGALRSIDCEPLCFVDNYKTGVVEINGGGGGGEYLFSK
jgi:hypothetical protein